jgi:hypothetical protein
VEQSVQSFTHTLTQMETGEKEDSNIAVSVYYSLSLSLPPSLSRALTL